MHTRDRLIASALLLAAAILIWAAVYLPVSAKVPAKIETVDRGATIMLSADDTTVLFDSACVAVHWRVDNIRHVELDGRGVVGQGESESCVGTIKLDVTYLNGRQRQFSIPKQAAARNPAIRVLLLTTAYLLALAVYVFGLPQALWRFLRTNRFAEWLRVRLPSTRDVRKSTREKRLFLVAMVAILLVGATLRATYLSKPLQNDESWTYFDFVSKPLAQGLTDYRSTNNHIFHTLLAHFSTSIFGIQPWTLRLPVYFAGILTVAATYAVGRRFYGPRTGVIAAALVAGSSWLVEYSTNARGYMLMTLFFLLLLLLAPSLRRPSTAKWLLFSALCTLGLYTLPIMAYAVGIVVVWLALSIMLENRGRRRWLLLRDMALSLLLAGVIAGLLYLPAYVYTRGLPANRLDLDSFQQIGMASMIQDYSEDFENLWALWHRDLAPGLDGLLVAGVVIGTVFHRQISRYRVNLAIMAFLWLASVLFLLMVTTFERIWVFLTPLYLILATAGLVYLWTAVTQRFGRPPAILVGLCAVAIAALTSLGVTRSDSIIQSGGVERALGAEAAILRLDELVGANDEVVCSGVCDPTQIYAIMHGIKVVTPHRDTESVSERRALYVIVTTPGQEQTLQPIMDVLRVTPGTYQPPVVVMQSGDTTVFRLEPARRSS